MMSIGCTCILRDKGSRLHEKKFEIIVEFFMYILLTFCVNKINTIILYKKKTTIATLFR